MIQLRTFLKIAFAACLTALVAYFLFLRTPQIRGNVSLRDSIAYWSAAQLLLQRENPYDHGAVLALEQMHGYRDQRPLVLRTPPWSLFTVAPLGWFSPFLAWVIWIGLSLTCLLLAIRICIRLYGLDAPANMFALAGYTFAPVPACLVSGQMGLVLLLGIVLFLVWQEDRPFWAGAALVLPFAKPHLLSLFWIVLLFWLVHRKQSRMLFGFLAALTVTAGFPLLFDIHIFPHYRAMLQTSAIANEFIPALSGVLRLLFFRRFFWMQFLPLVAGIVWALRFFSKNRPTWDWRVHGPALLIVSVLVTPYEWLSDETLLLPAILQGVAFTYAARKNLGWAAKLAVVLFALLDLLLLLILKSKIPFSTGIYFWSTLVWFFWYFLARRWHRRAAASQSVI